MAEKTLKDLKKDVNEKFKVLKASVDYHIDTFSGIRRINDRIASLERATNKLYREANKK